MVWTLLALLGTAQAADLQHQLVWDVQVEGQNVGTRQLTVKYIAEPGQVGMRRILESFTDLQGRVGPIQMTFKQRMTAHASGPEPASLHSVVDANGSPMEVQARWTPGAWWVTTTASGRSRTIDMPLNRIDVSTADLMDPDTRFPIAHFGQLRLLSAETGEVTVGQVAPLDVKQMRVGGEEVQVHGYSFTAPEGQAEFWYSQDGFLVAYTLPLLGMRMQATLQKPPPGGIDDFPVAIGIPQIEEIDL